MSINKEDIMGVKVSSTSTILFTEDEGFIIKPKNIVVVADGRMYDIGEVIRCIEACHSESAISSKKESESAKFCRLCGVIIIPPPKGVCSDVKCRTKLAIEQVNDLSEEEKYKMIEKIKEAFNESKNNST